mgnify:CR=1 FL=1
MSDPILRKLVLGWHHDSQRWAVVSLHEDGRWYFYRDKYDENAKKSGIRAWIELPDPPRSLCDVSELDQARAAAL